MIIHTCGSCGKKITDEELQKTHIKRQGYFCPHCGKKKDGRTWEKRVTQDFTNMDEEKTKNIVSSMKQTIKSREESRRQSEGLLL